MFGRRKHKRPAAPRENMKRGLRGQDGALRAGSRALARFVLGAVKLGAVLGVLILAGWGGSLLWRNAGPWMAELFRVREITVVGDHMMVVWNDTLINEPVRIYHKSVDVEREPAYTDSFGAFQISIRHGDIVTPHISGHEPLAAECRHFTDCILGRAEPINSARASLGVLAALEAADKSMRQRSEVVKVERRSTTEK